MPEQSKPSKTTTPQSQVPPKGKDIEDRNVIDRDRDTLDRDRTDRDRDRDRDRTDRDRDRDRDDRDSDRSDSRDADSGDDDQTYIVHTEVSTDDKGNRVEKPQRMTTEEFQKKAPKENW